MSLFDRAPRVSDLNEYRRFPVVRNEPPIRERIPTREERDFISLVTREEWGNTPQIFKVDNPLKS
jgi:hypothetical protein